jgi:flavin-dependent dehydrogenase
MHNSPSVRFERYVIIGGGPAGCTAAILLKRLGKEVCLIDPLERPPLIVGESLIPATVPLLQKLGIESLVREVGLLKKGARIQYPGIARWDLDFSDTGIEDCTYAYHIERSILDSILLEQARSEGVLIYRDRAVCKVVDGALKWKTAQGKCEMQPGDFIVDATGRARTFTKTLRLAFQKGFRNDRVLFCHQKGVELSSFEHFHLDVCSDGWVWRIPLPGKVSIGGVFPSDWWRGDNPSESMQYLIEQTPLRNFVQTFDAGASIAQYKNYQRQSSVVSGANWVLVGDACGFLDPVFSSGLCLAMKTAECFVESIDTEFLSWRETYGSRVRNLFDYWNEVVTSFYDGSFEMLVRAGLSLRKRSNSSAPFTGAITRVLSGCGTDEDLADYRTALSFSQSFCKAAPDEGIRAV